MPRSHKPEVRDSAVAMLAKGASLRRVAAVHGVGKSTVKRWNDVVMASGGATANVASSASASTLGAYENETPATVGSAYSPGAPASAALPRSKAEPNQNAQTEPHVEGEAEYHHLVGDEQPPNESGFLARIHDPIFLRALHRYLNAVATGTRPYIALEGARMVDPYFTLSWPEQRVLHQALERFTGAEDPQKNHTGTAVGIGVGVAAIGRTPIFTDATPGWVSEVAQDYQFDEVSREDLIDALAYVRTDGGLAGINAQLGALNRPTLLDITDEDLLGSIRSDAADVARLIASNWNSDVAAAVWKLWQSLGDDGTEADLRSAVQDWRDGRADWKAQQWSFDSASQGMYDATRMFQDQNGTGETGRVVPSSAQCEACQAAVDLGEVDIDTLLSLDLPLHPGCVVPDTLVAPIGQLLAASKARYSGPTITLRTRSASLVTLTPNHPVLTGRGWLAAEAVREGDHVLRITGMDHDAMPHEGLHRIHRALTMVHRATVAAPRARIDLDHMPVLAEDVFEALTTVGHRLRTVSTSADFHGDGKFMNGEVDVVRAHGLLPGVGDATSVEQECERLFMGALARDRSQALAGAGSHLHLGDVPRATAHSGVGRIDSHGVVATMAEGNASLNQAVSAGLIRDPESRCDGADGETCLVEGDRLVDGESDSRRSVAMTSDAVIEVSHGTFTGHVFNLETTAGMFTADGIVTHNCPHDVEISHGDVPADQELWGQDLGPIDDGSAGGGDEQAA